MLSRLRPIGCFFPFCKKTHIPGFVDHMLAKALCFKLNSPEVGSGNYQPVMFEMDLVVAERFPVPSTRNPQKEICGIILVRQEFDKCR